MVDKVRHRVVAWNLAAAAAAGQAEEQQEGISVVSAQNVVETQCLGTGKLGSDERSFTGPAGVAVCAQTGRVFVVDQGNKLVKIFR